MILRRLRLRNFRNYTDCIFDFHEGINCILGKNAQGKTNLLESIYYLSTTRSHRISDDADLICKEAEFFGIEAVLEKQGRKEELRIHVSANGKNLSVFRNPVKKVSDFIGICNAVMFCPDDMFLFNAQPRVRRRFMDIELGKLSKSYMAKLNEYTKLLKERNAVLKNENFSMDYLEVLNEQMAGLQAVLLKQRVQFMSDLLTLSSQFYQALSSDDTTLSLAYISSVDTNQEETVLKQCFMERYHANFERDRFMKSTSSGIHKDDFTILINGKDAADYASQGQKRTILLAMKVGIVMMITSLKKEPPILLLDDVFSELDQVRREKLLNLLPKNLQIFISATELENNAYGRKLSIYTIEHGKLKN